VVIVTLGTIGRRGVVTIGLGILAGTAGAQAAADSGAESRAAAIAKSVAGVGAGFVMHEAGHVLFDVALGAGVGVRGVKGAGIAFFAITHRDMPPASEFVISSAGFWVQHATNEVLLSRRPGLRHEHAPLLKGIFAFNLLNSAMYSVAAFGHIGPPERDTRGMAISAGVDEPVVGAMLLAPAVLDAARYYRPDAKGLRWASRIVKLGGVALLARARR
jgi:hypothetical protein